MEAIRTNNAADETTAALPPLEIWRVELQRFLSWLVFFPLNTLVTIYLGKVRGLSIENLAQIRDQFRQIAKRNRPLLVCGNHLTMLDSVIMMWAFASLPYYFFNFRLYAWNIPAKENFVKYLSLRIITYLCKCIPIERHGSAKHKERIVQKLNYLLSRKEVCMLFPEGTRSRTGRVVLENLTYGVGNMVVANPECDVLCVYLRGSTQEIYSNIPHKGDSMSMTMELIALDKSTSGRRLARDISHQVINKIKQMEDRYFEQRASKDRTALNRQ